MAELALKQILKKFGQSTAVEPTDLVLRSGELTTLLGPSGCGKTTLLRMIAGLEQPSAGSIELDGEDITAWPAHKRRFGMVFQSFALFPHLSVIDNVAYSLTIAGVDKQRRLKEAAELLALVLLDEFAQRRIGELSGGQRQRVAIARALAQKPSVFLLDEPMSALDAKLREDMQIELRLLQQRLGITTVVVTHDQREAMTIADSVVVMSHGKVQQTGAPDAIYNNPDNPFVASFIGKANLFNATVSQGELHIGDVKLATKKPLNFINGASVQVFARPEQTRIVDQRGENTLRARVVYVRNVGPTLEIHLDSEHGPILIDTPNDRASSTYQQGQSVNIQLPDDQLTIFPQADAA